MGCCHEDEKIGSPVVELICSTNHVLATGDPTMMMAKEMELLKARDEFRSLVEFIERATSEGLRIDEVERGLWQGVLRVGFALLKAFVAEAGDGDVGKTYEHEGKTLHRLEEPRPRRYVSIFGELEIARYVYALREKQRARAPLDAQSDLP